MSEPDKKFYWLKLKKDFFKRHDIRIIEAMPNGKDYILFYLKLLVESLDHDGELRFSDSIPYTEEMLATITNTNVDIVRSAIKLFTQLNMMSKFDDGTILLIQVGSMTGSETAYAEKKRIYRQQKQLQISADAKDIDGTKKDNVRQEIRDKSKEKDNKDTLFFSEDSNRVAMLLISEHRKTDPGYAMGNEAAKIKSWVKHIDNIARIDKRDWQTITDVMIWCKNNSFWCSNIMSGDKFRKQFDKLYAAMLADKNKTQSYSKVEDLPEAPPEVLARIKAQQNA